MRKYVVAGIISALLFWFGFGVCLRILRAVFPSTYMRNHYVVTPLEKAR